MHHGNDALLADIRKLWKGVLIVNRPGRPRKQIGRDLAAGMADLESYGAMVLANPDFVERLRTNARMNEPQREGFFGGTERFYTDTPTLIQAQED